MRAEYDPEARAVYVYSDHPDAGRKASVKKTLVDLLPGVNVDIGHDNKLLGVEFLGLDEGRVELANIDKDLQPVFEAATKPLKESIAQCQQRIEVLQTWIDAGGLSLDQKDYRQEKEG